MAVASGLDILCTERLALCHGRRVGLLCHPASVASDYAHALDKLMTVGVTPVRLFGPEHGIRGEAQDMIGVEGGRDPRSGIPEVSLYGETFESLIPTQAQLAGLDVLVIDLQDIGSRYYTFIWTMALAMQAAADAGVQVVVLDRPNPLGGVAVEGGAVEIESFVGLGSVPVRHGMTIGEIARLVKAGLPWGLPRFARPMDVDLEVVTMRGWRRDMAFEDTGLPWVLPSPNMPTVDTAWVYPGMCLLEGTNVSEGRGCTRPFEIVGAPFIDSYRLAAALTADALPGVVFRPLTFRPTFHKHGGKPCGGVQLHVTDRRTFLPYATGVAMLRQFRRLCGDAFVWRTERYEFVSDHPAIDLLTGSAAVRLAIDAGADLAEITAQWKADEAAFHERRAPYLLYT
ncbi:MAG: DUF1343 domain-containing protein [Deltaproteobacteria bacterium]|nr:DUF1343 domain-containing protein [Deltaproteobacteria bacterium]